MRVAASRRWTALPVGADPRHYLLRKSRVQPKVHTRRHVISTIPCIYNQHCLATKPVYSRYVPTKQLDIEEETAVGDYIAAPNVQPDHHSPHPHTSSARQSDFVSFQDGDAVVNAADDCATSIDSRAGMDVNAWYDDNHALGASRDGCSIDWFALARAFSKLGDACALCKEVDFADLIDELPAAIATDHIVDAVDPVREAHQSCLRFRSLVFNIYTEYIQSLGECWEEFGVQPHGPSVHDAIEKFYAANPIDVLEEPCRSCRSRSCPPHVSRSALADNDIITRAGLTVWWEFRNLTKFAEDHAVASPAGLRLAWLPISNG